MNENEQIFERLLKEAMAAEGNPTPPQSNPSEQEHWLTKNFRKRVMALDDKLVVNQLHGFSLPDRNIADGNIVKSHRNRIIEAGSGQQIFRGAEREIHVCRFTLNTALSPGIEFSDMHPEAHQRLHPLMQKGLEEREELFAEAT